MSIPAAEEAALALSWFAGVGSSEEAEDILDASARCKNEEKESVDPAAALVDDIDIAATADTKAESAPCESTIVVMQEEFGSGGSLTLVMIPGTTSEK